MDWQQISVSLDREDVAQAEALLSLSGAVALTFDDAADSPLFEPAIGTTPLWPTVTVQALIPQHLDAMRVARLLEHAVPTLSELSIREIRHADWEQGLQQNVAAKRIAANLQIVPAQWSGASSEAELVRLNMGLAFGTGRHPTTTLCLEWLAANPPTGARVYDFGCGSGVLVIAALKLGAAYAYASDLDPQALSATLSNAALNSVGDLIWTGTPDALPKVALDLVVANILAGTLIESATALAGTLKPGAKLVLSGILTEQRESIQGAYAEEFEQFEHSDLDGWTCISAIRSQ